MPSTRRALAGLLAVTATLGLGACTMSTLSSARPIDPQETQVFVAPSVTRSRAGRAGKPLLSPQIEAGGRYGISRRWDAGMRAWLPLPGWVVDAKYAIKRTDLDGGKWDFSVAPGAGWIGGIPGSEVDDSSSLHVLTFHLPFLAGRPFGAGHELVLAPKLVQQVWLATGPNGSTASLLHVGGSAAVLFQVTENLKIAPELSMGWQVVGSLSGFGYDVGLGGSHLQFSLGLLFGGKAPPPVRCAPVDLPRDVTG